MSNKRELNLIHTVSWLSLLKCRAEVLKLASGDILEVILNNLDTVNALCKIAESSCDEVIYFHKEGSNYRVGIQKQ